MAKPKFIELADGLQIPILYEDRTVLAIDKPAGWMLAPDSWVETGRNLQLALVSSIEARDFWAQSRNLKFLRYVHRLDAETSGVLLMARNPGAVHAYGDLFESRRIEKVYLAIVQGIPNRPEWTCNEPLSPDPRQAGRMIVDKRGGKETVTRFRVLESIKSPVPATLIEAHPLTGRTHQIRLHLQASGHPIVGDPVYVAAGTTQPPRRNSGRTILGLRAVSLRYADPFTRRKVRIEAPRAEFLAKFGFPVATCPATG
jgi:RluA family pseudouridine synthase